MRDKIYGFLIKTDSYAGNFEREMCAYITGVVGECGVGKQYKNEEVANLFYENISFVPDEHGCSRPVSMLAADEKFIISHLNHEQKCNSLVIYFDSAPSKDQIEIMKKRAYEFPQVRENNKHDYDTKSLLFNILGFELLETSIGTTSTEI